MSPMLKDRTLINAHGLYALYISDALVKNEPNVLQLYDYAPIVQRSRRVAHHLRGIYVASYEYLLVIYLLVYI